MDDFNALFTFQQAEEDLGREAEGDRLEAAAAALAIIVGGAEVAREHRNERRRETRQYLVRGELLRNPRVATPWQVLYESRSDRAYITTMGFDVETFDYILETFQYTWLSTSIPQTCDASRTGNPRPGARSLDPPGALGLALHYLSSTMHDVSLQQIFALIPSTVSRYISFALDILLACLRRMPDAVIQWPRDGEFQECNDLILMRHPLLIGAFAAIDGLNVPLQTSQDEDIENATYNGWLSEHFISSVLVFSPRGQSPSGFSR